MALIGLTGGPGAGKSLAAYYLQLKGAAIISGDDTGREVIDSYPVVLKRLVKEFGITILNPDDTFNRKKMGQIAFGNPEALKKLNAIVHPNLLKLLKSKIKKLKEKSPRKMVVVDAALIYEWKIKSWFDSVLVITAKREICVKRLMSFGMSKSEAILRIGSQWPQRKKASRADHVIENNGNKIALRNKIYSFLKKVKAN